MKKDNNNEEFYSEVIPPPHARTRICEGTIKSGAVGM
jgi:hypothetical protein